MSGHSLRRFAATICCALWSGGLAGGLVAASAADPQPDAQVSRQRIESALASVRPALVRLTVVSRQFSDGRAVRYASSGSGVVVTPEGDLLTNFHVAGRSERIQATLATGEVIDADVVAHDPLTDLSVLRLRLETRASDAPALEPARFRDSVAEVGEPVLALGSPLTLASSVTLGIVSNTRRVFTDFTGTRLEDMDLEGEPTGLLTQWIQHDALILPGNSGGPLVDLDGAIIGINELGGAGVGFAIPAALARSVLQQALLHGGVRRSELGFSVLPVAKLGLRRGALVASVTPDSAAARAGVVAGDLLLAIADQPVEVRFFEQLPELYRRISEVEIGSELTLDLERNGKPVRLTVTTERMAGAVGDEAEIAELGAAVQEVTAPMAFLRQIAPKSGLLVTSLRTGLAAANAKPAIEAGDLLAALAGRPTRTIAELRAAIAAAGLGEQLAEIRRDDEQLLTVVRLGDDRSVRRGGELAKAWLGVQTQVVTKELAQAMVTPELRGFRVTQVLPWSAAERAGLAAGDVIVAVDGEPLEAQREQDRENLRRLVEERAIGDRLDLEVERAGQRRRLVVELERRPRDRTEVRMAKQEQLGFSMRDLTLFDRVEFHLAREQQGVLVTEIVAGGWAQMAGLESDDLILSVDGTTVADLSALEPLLANRLEARRKVMSLFVRRGAKTHFVFVEPVWESARTAGGEKR